MAIINVPAPVQIPGVGNALALAIQNALPGLLQGQQNRLLGQDIQSFGQFNQFQQQFAGAEQGVAGLRGLTPQQAGQAASVTFPAFTPQPVAQSRAFQNLQAQGIAQQQFGDPFGTQRAQTGLAQAQTIKALRPPVPKTSFQQIPDPDTGKTINALVRTDTGDIIKNFGATETLTPKDKTQIAVTQAKEFRADPRIKNFQIIERSERGMQAALKKATSPNSKSRIAADQTLGVLFQKMLDPESVVRESEFARTPEGAALMSRITSQIPKLLRGGLAISDDDRRALVDMAQTLLNQAKISANNAFDEFTIRADEIGLNKKIVFGGAKRFNVSVDQNLQFTPDQIEAELKRRGAIQ